MSKILIISGSRDPEGYTARAMSAFSEGAALNEGQTESVFLPTLKLERCRQCENSGWGKCIEEGECVIEDDFASTVNKVRSADSLVIANPVYYGDLSESLKTFLDRLRRIGRHDNGKKGVAGKKTAGICVSGGGGGGSYNCTTIMEQTFGHIGLDTVDLIPSRRQNFEMKLMVFKIAGEWFAKA